MPAFDPLTYRYASRRNVVYAQNAVACTFVLLGAQIGLDVMKSGGSAVDAAVAMAAAMPLLEPTGNGLGSNCFALVWNERDKRLYGLNASGVAPMALSAEKVRAMGYTEMPKAGWLPTMVPGAPAGWAELNRRFGTKWCRKRPSRWMICASAPVPPGRRTPSGPCCKTILPPCISSSC